MLGGDRTASLTMYTIGTPSAGTTGLPHRASVTMTVWVRRVDNYQWLNITILQMCKHVITLSVQY